jgi:PAS domain S-box-containing protein
MAGISLLVLLVLYLVIARFTRPIIRLTEATTAMADGDLDQQIKLSGNDEVGTLARSFNHMRDSIRQKILELEKENEARQRAQDALATEKERLAVTLRSIGDGVITTDISGKVVFINKVAEVLTGWNSEEARGRDLDEIFNIINEQTRETWANPATKVINSGQIVGLANHTVLIARDGTERSIADSGAPIFDAASAIIGVVRVFRDVTEQIRTEKELLKVQKLESVGVLAGGIAHDFNNILAAILGNINLALFDKGLKDETKNLLAAAEKASLRAKDLTGQLLTFSKGGEPVKEMASLENVIKDSASFVLHGDKVACHYTIPENLWMVDIDKGQISQVIQNLVVNASQAMREGGKIQITCENIHVSGDSLPFESGTFAKDRGCGAVKISIRDNGTGIPAGVLEKIFDPYFSTKKKGSGLGLAITHSIISKHGGHIAAESKPGNGSTFTIYLPATEERVEKQPEVSDVKKSAKSVKILVMDDEELLRSISESMLLHLGHQVVSAADGKEAIKLYRQAMSTEPFDLVIMDLTIPGGMGGKEAVGEILNLDPKAKVVVSSGYSNDPVMANFRNYGFSAAMVKPFQLSDMTKVTNEI